MPLYQNVFGEQINVHGKAIQPNEVFKDVEDNEIKNLLFHKYLAIIEKKKPEEKQQTSLFSIMEKKKPKEPITKKTPKKEPPKKVPK